MNDDLPPDPSTRRGLIVWYDDALNEVALDADAFTWLEVPELLRAALDIAETNLPVTRAAEDEEAE